MFSHSKDLHALLCLTPPGSVNSCVVYRIALSCSRLKREVGRRLSALRNVRSSQTTTVTPQQAVYLGIKFNYRHLDVDFFFFI